MPNAVAAESGVSPDCTRNGTTCTIIECIATAVKVKTCTICQ
jgi:hypothetical protein